MSLQFLATIFYKHTVHTYVYVCCWVTALHNSYVNKLTASTTLHFIIEILFITLCYLCRFFTESIVAHTSTHSPVTYTTHSLMRIHALEQLLSHMTSHCFLIRSVAAHLLTRPPKGGSASIVLYFTLRWCSLLEVLSLVETIVFHNRYVHTYTQCKCTYLL